jgi:hypothetical protein
VFFYAQEGFIGEINDRHPYQYTGNLILGAFKKEGFIDEIK